ncbi:Neurofilament medium polypeptide [Actinoplanes sp. SE50]|uniref:LPXTG cell wall anchor domain-containing protein n=1 Tax=unclassified Actinoplanes TaxID=2626549 RepID=UPI00023EBC6B|nr:MULTISPECIES: LPXTG cell wall anchor domain-containing protein [unclassified Actinoplanes]AEV87956.1 Neurofilament medium polypeptide [Actinoplanes sp. SE50/110]ATO86360.1 Neurofilament medium polypeptide [Actinoplanes sp. SE50]SLM03775.1 hypothetical protein ACSP50_7074 [Actinoplanes sp. SE50/110]
MSFVRRLAVGIPAAGVTAFAALAISSPVLAASFDAAHPAVHASADRGNAGYGAASPATTTPAATAPAATTPAAGGPTATVVATTPPAAVSPAAASPDTVGGTRGHAGYGEVSPTGGAKTVPGGVSPTEVPSPITTKGSGVSSGSLPLTGRPVGATVAVGAVLVAGGAGALWYTRRRKSA